MTYVVLATLSSLACIVASAKRLQTVIAPIGLSLDELSAHADSIRKESLEPASGMATEHGARAFHRMRQLLTGLRSDSWEHELGCALALPPSERRARIGELVTDFEHIAGRGMRVPRVCASLSTTSAFLLSTLMLRRGLSSIGGADDIAVMPLVEEAVAVIALGIMGAVFCAVIHAEASKLRRRALSNAALATEALDEVVERIYASNERIPHATSEKTNGRGHDAK